MWAVDLGGCKPALHNMDNLPDQHIDSLPNLKRGEAYQQIALLCAARFEKLSEVEVAKKAKFDDDKDMYFRLERWGLSGLVPPEEAAEKEHSINTSSGKPKTLRQPQPSKESGRKLPALANATDLFRDTIDTLAAYLEGLPRSRGLGPVPAPPFWRGH